MRRSSKIAFLTALYVLPLCLVSCGGGLDVPEFEDGEGIDFTAYAGPTVENWAGNNQNVNGLTLENYQKLADAGFTKVIALYEGASNATGSDIYETIKARSEKAEKDALTALSLAEQVGISYYVRDWSYYGLVKNFVDQGIDSAEEYKTIIDAMFDSSNPYIHSSAYAGNFGHDEPSYEMLPLIKEQVELYDEALEREGATGETLVNLNPAYVAGSSLSSDASVTYQDYVDRYFEELAPLLGYVSYDYYPFREDQIDGSYLRTSYLYNLELMARKCKETGTELRTFLQCCGDFTGLRDMTSIGDFRFQIACSMAFGAKEITYYCYSTETGEDEGDFGLYDYKTGDYAWTYDLAKKVNAEAHAMEDAYCAYSWDGVMTHNADPMYENLSFLNIEEQLESHPRVSFVESTQDAILGTFKNDEGDDAFMLVNYTDPYFQLDNEVTLHFNDARGLLMYRLGQKMVVELPSSGDYTFKLYPGEGRFIIPLS
jgi:hypothetical protein